MSNPRAGLVLIRAFRAYGIGTCVRVSCMTPHGHRSGEIPLSWWKERTGYYERRGLNAVETCFLALEEWEEVTTKVQEN